MTFEAWFLESFKTVKTPRWADATWIVTRVLQMSCILSPFWRKSTGQSKTSWQTSAEMIKWPMVWTWKSQPRIRIIFNKSQHSLLGSWPVSEISRTPTVEVKHSLQIIEPNWTRSDQTKPRQNDFSYWLKSGMIWWFKIPHQTVPNRTYSKKRLGSMWLVTSSLLLL